MQLIYLHALPFLVFFFLHLCSTPDLCVSLRVWDLELSKLFFVQFTRDLSEYVFLFIFFISSYTQKVRDYVNQGK